MPIDPMIAGGIEYPDFTRTIALAEEIKNRREYNRLGALDQQMRQQKFEADQQQATQEQEKLRQDQQFAILIPMAEKGNEAAIDELAKRVDGLNPAAGIAFRTDPAQRAEALKVFRQQFGIPAEKVPGEMAVQRFPGFGSVLTQGGEYKGSRPDPAPQQPQQPTSEVRNWQFRQSLPPDQRAEYDRLYGKGGDPTQNPVRMENRANDAQNVLTAITEAKALISPLSAGFIGQKTRGQGGTPAFDLNSKIDTIKANIGFDRLQRMREESKKGGALGQVAVQELTMLQAVITSLDSAQSPKQLEGALTAVESQYTKAMQAYDAAMQEQGGDTGSQADPLGIR
jgi:hypothetical protein